ncbi:MAG: hypothetical protein M0013_14725 [Actinomycetota bacterium]|nr:hypothetical protein [Actinomycetota bacterium]
MTHLIRIEWLKLRTMRMGFGVLATSASLTALFASLEASLAGNSTIAGPLPFAGATALVAATFLTAEAEAVAAVAVPVAAAEKAEAEAGGVTSGIVGMSTTCRTGRSTRVRATRSRKGSPRAATPL